MHVQQLPGHVLGTMIHPARQVRLGSLQHAAAARQDSDGLAHEHRLEYRQVEMHSLRQAMHVEQLSQWSSRGWQPIGSSGAVRQPQHQMQAKPVSRRGSKSDTAPGGLQQQLEQHIWHTRWPGNGWNAPNGRRVAARPDPGCRPQQAAETQVFVRHAACAPGATFSVLLQLNLLGASRLTASARVTFHVEQTPLPMPMA